MAISAPAVFGPCFSTGRARPSRKTSLPPLRCPPPKAAGSGAGGRWQGYCEVVRLTRAKARAEYRLKPETGVNARHISTSALVSENGRTKPWHDA